MPELNPTHDPAARSWVPSANVAGCDFPIQNLPYAMFAEAGTGEVCIGFAECRGTVLQVREL